MNICNEPNKVNFIFPLGKIYYIVYMREIDDNSIFACVFDVCELFLWKYYFQITKKKKCKIKTLI